MIVGVLFWLGLLTASASASLEFDAGSPVSIVTAASPVERYLGFTPPAPVVPGPVIEPEGTEATSPWPPDEANEPAGAKDEPGGLSVWLGRAIPVVLAAVVLIVLWKRDVIRLGSFSAAGRTREVGSPWFVWVVAGIVVFMAAQMGSAVTLALVGEGSRVGKEDGGLASMPLRTLAIVGLGSYAAGIVAAVVMARLLARTAEGFGVKARHFAAGVGCFVMAYPVVFAVSSVSVMIAKLVREGEPPRVAHESLRQIIDNSGNAWAWVLAGTAVIGAPIVEEMIYRVFLQTGLLRAIGKPWLAIWITAALFAAAHVSVVEVYALPTLFVLGAAMGLAYERTKSPVVPIVMHVLFNGLNVAMAMWLDGG